jgi:hypothetical protein
MTCKTDAREIMHIVQEILRMNVSASESEFLRRRLQIALRVHILGEFTAV